MSRYRVTFEIDADSDDQAYHRGEEALLTASSRRPWVSGMYLTVREGERTVYDSERQDKDKS